MGPEGGKRQRRWNGLGWVRLAFEAMRRHKHEGDGPAYPETPETPAAGTPHMVLTKWFVWIEGRKREKARNQARRQERLERFRNAITRVIHRLRAEKVIRQRQQQRGDRICARTRGAETAHRRNYSETRRNNKRIGDQELYKLSALAQKDKIGRCAWLVLERLRPQ